MFVKLINKTWVVMFFPLQEKIKEKDTVSLQYGRELWEFGLSQKAFGFSQKPITPLAKMNFSTGCLWAFKNIDPNKTKDPLLYEPLKDNSWVIMLSSEQRQNWHFCEMEHELANSLCDKIQFNQDKPLSLQAAC